MNLFHIPEQAAYELLEAGMTVPKSDWSFLPPEIPEGVSAHNMPYIRFIAEELSCNNDRDELQTALNKLDSMNESTVRSLYVAYKSMYQSPPKTQS